MRDVASARGAGGDLTAGTTDPLGAGGRGTPADATLLATVEDGEGRTIRFRPYEPSARRALVAMYTTFDPTERAQGIPPVRDEAVESWLDAVLGGPSVLAWHRDRVAGHVMFVPDDEGDHELAIFVHQDHQSAGVGSALLEHGLTHARREDVERVWLTVDSGNGRARHLYEKAGFRREDMSGGALWMAREL